AGCGRMSGRILIVDDDPDQRELLDLGLKKRGFSTVVRAGAEEALEIAVVEDFDVVVTDLKLRGMSGLDLCKRLAATRSNLAVIVISGYGSMEAAIEAIRAGAYDFITKPFDLEVLRLALDRAVNHRALNEEVTRLRRVVAESEQFGQLLGTSP